MASAYPWLVLTPVLGLAVYCGSHLLLTRIFSGRSPYPALLGGFVPGLLAIVILTGWTLWRMQVDFCDVVGYGLLNLVSYGALGWCYFHFVNLCIASLRIRILEEIAEAGGFLSKETLLSRYNTEGMIGLRIERLVGGGHFIVRDDRYHRGKSHFLWIARLFDALRWFILGSRGTR